MKPIVRYAPSPTGRLHLGNARPALLNWLFKLRTGGTYVLRLDDTDRERSTEAFAAAIEEDLRWLGISPDKKVRQSDRTAIYDAARDRLIAAGRLYPAYETEEELEIRRGRARLLGRPPIYDRAALSLTDEQKRALEAEGRKPHWRFRLDGRAVQFNDLIKGPQTVNTGSMSDPVLIRGDGSYTYTLPSVVDDIDLGITHVIRGEDHVSNTGTQIELFEALGGAVPEFAHHNLLTGADGEGLSKRLGSLSLGELRDAGYEPMAVTLVAVLTGTSLPVEPLASLDELAGRFELSMVSHGAARFDPAELGSINARLLHAMPYEVARSRLPAEIDAAAWDVLRANIPTVEAATEWVPVLKGDAPRVALDDEAAFLAEALEALPPEPWDAETWAVWTGALKAKTGRKGRALFHPLRVALTGREDGPELKSLLPLLGRRVCLARLS